MSLDPLDLDTLAPGHAVTYARTANLARLRASTKRQPDPQIAMADAAWRAALAGRVSLLQRKLDSGEYAYIAVGRKKVDPCPVEPRKVEPEMRRTKKAA